MNTISRLTLLLLLPLNLLANEGIEFFEAKIRPILVEHCYECHNSSGKAKAKLALDYKGGVLKGGSEGPAIAPGKPEESLLLKTIRHEFEDLRMPKNGPRLSKNVLEDFRKWIAMGAPDPRDKPPSAEQLAKTTSWEALRERRKKWWSFQPIKKQQLPEVAAKDWSGHPVDKFLLAGMEQAKLAPNEETDALAALRRLSFAITGLPPTPAQQETYAKEVEKDAGAATEKLVDDLLASPQFGERWARHWLDVAGFAETDGLEDDIIIG